MSRNAEPQFRRTPGSMILTVVFLGIAALVNFAGAIAVMPLVPPVGVLLLVSGIIHIVLAIGIESRMKWAAAGAMMWSGLMIIVIMIASIEQASTNSTPLSGVPVLYILMAIFVTRKNTLAWCNVGGGQQSSSSSTDREPEPEDEGGPTYSDQVELIGHLDEYGLRAGSIGTIVDVHDDPESFDVEFTDDRTETTALVALRPDQLRFIADPR